MLFVGVGLGLLGAERPPPRSVCADADWACVSECIDQECVLGCYPPTCLRVLAALRTCAERRGCPPDDARCTEETCEAHCDAAFGARPKGRAARAPDPCVAHAAPDGGAMPRKLVGDWELIAATMPSVDAGQELTPTPRPDYTRYLRVTPSGCFVLETPLAVPTVGSGNEVVVRSSGQVRITGKDQLTLQTTRAHAEGSVCLRPVSKPLPSRRFRRPGFQYVVEGRILSLTANTEGKETFQFKRADPR